MGSPGWLVEGRGGLVGGSRALVDPGGGQPDQSQLWPGKNPFWSLTFKTGTILRIGFGRTSTTIFID